MLIQNKQKVEKRHGSLAHFDFIVATGAVFDGGLKIRAQKFYHNIKTKKGPIFSASQFSAEPSVYSKTPSKTAPVIMACSYQPCDTSTSEFRGFLECSNNSVKTQM